MALLETHIFSDSLGMSCGVEVLLPQRSIDGEIPVLWLLHGLSDDHTTWVRRTNIERYVEGLNLAVIMPNAHRSFYCDMSFGPAYETFIAKELPDIARRLFRISARRADNFIAGLSMGGYGAFKLAMKYPARYAAAASLSGAMDISAFWKDEPHRRDARLIFTENPAGTENDLFYLAGELMKSGKPRPRLFQCCGTEDFLYANNLAFRDHARKLDFGLDYREDAGNHEWGYWDARIQDVLRWLFPCPAQ